MADKLIEQLNDTTYEVKVKEEWTDRLSVEIGDEKQEDFHPQIKIKRIAWNKGKRGIYSKETLKKMREAKLGNKLSKEHRSKISNSLKGRIPKNLKTLDNSGSNSHWWKGGITNENELIRKHKEFKLWRKLVFERDNYICQKSGIIGGTLHPHHIKNFAQYPELRFAIDNGITLSEKAHKEFHRKYGLKNNNEVQLNEFLKI